jgi:4-hydroxy-4-methyl-2-oxoglutarate aldolase
LVRPLTTAQLNAIKRFDTCTISNVIEEFGVRLRNESYTRPGLRCIFEDLPPMLGYAATSRIKCSHPPPTDHAYVDRTDWWSQMGTLPAPLKCAGVVTDGAVRDLSPVRAMKFPMFACHVSVSHAYAHMVDFGGPVEIRGLKINSGDLLYGDRHGVLSIPNQIAGEIAAKAAALMKRERRVIDLCRSPAFTIEKLRIAVKDLP